MRNRIRHLFHFVQLSPLLSEFAICMYALRLCAQVENASVVMTFGKNNICMCRCCYRITPRCYRLIFANTQTILQTFDGSLKLPVQMLQTAKTAGKSASEEETSTGAVHRGPLE